MSRSDGMMKMVHSYMDDKPPPRTGCNTCAFSSSSDEQPDLKAFFFFYITCLSGASYHHSPPDIGITVLVVAEDNTVVL